MSRTRTVLTVALALGLALAPALVFARAGDGGSFGSRGSRSFSMPGPTNTSPYGAAPLQRSLTPPSAGAPFNAPRYSPGYQGGLFQNRSPFVSGLMGGLIGAGIGGLLFGGGLFHGISGFGGFLGLLLQIFLIAIVARWLLRRLFRSGAPAMAGGPGLFARMAGPQANAAPSGSYGGAGYGGAAQPASRALAIGPGDYQAFEQLLKQVQAAWSEQSVQHLRTIATPEMVSYFAEQLGEQASRGLRNTVTDVRLERGDLAEAWSENGRDYATVAMRFSMLDVTRDSAGRVVDGSLAERVMATEYWTFLRAPGGRWILSAIQQAR